MDVNAAFEAFLSDGALVRLHPDVADAIPATTPRRTTRVLDRMPELPTAAEEREAVLAQRARARQVERAEKKGQPIAEYGPMVRWVVEDGGERREVSGRLSELRRAFPDAAEVQSQARAGVRAPEAPKRIVQL
ncbi:hypothetical protein D3C87_1328180 [compost metagenome]